MKDTAKVPETIDDYIAGFPLEVQATLREVRETVRRAAPEAEERISYRMPAFFEKGALVYFAVFKKHIGFYPPVRDETLKPALKKYAVPKGNLQFPLSEPIPFSLISRIVKARLRENRERSERGRAPEAGTRRKQNSARQGSAESDPGSASPSSGSSRIDMPTNSI